MNDTSNSRPCRVHPQTAGSHPCSTAERKRMMVVPAIIISMCQLWALAAMAADPDGFVSLFNGRDLSGWKMGPAKSWVVENGAIALKRPRYEAKEHNSDYLWAVEPYGNFILELDVKFLEKANSGIYLRTANTRNPVPTGLEVQVINSHGQPKLDKRASAGALYDCVAPASNAIKPPGEWNHFRITCRGSKVSVVLNGQPIIDADLNQWTEPQRNPDGTKNKFATPLKDFVRTGYVGFQDHGLPVWYRNIRIKKLDGLRG
jgi:hypothetical protein